MWDVLICSKDTCIREGSGYRAFRILTPPLGLLASGWDLRMGPQIQKALYGTFPHLKYSRFFFNKINKFWKHGQVVGNFCMYHRCVYWAWKLLANLKADQGTQNTKKINGLWFQTREHHSYVYWAWKLQELQKKKLGNRKNCKRRNVVCNRVICKVTLCFTPYLLCFHPLSPLLVVSAKWRNFIKSGYEMLKFSI